MAEALAVYMAETAAANWPVYSTYAGSTANTLLLLLQLARAWGGMELHAAQAQTHRQAQALQFLGIQPARRRREFTLVSVDSSITSSLSSRGSCGSASCSVASHVLLLRDGDPHALARKSLRAYL